MVSVNGKGATGLRQVRIREINESERLTKCRKVNIMLSKLGVTPSPGQVQAKPVYGLGGNRHLGRMNLIQALVWNVRTCRFDEKGKIQVEDPQG